MIISIFIHMPLVVDITGYTTNLFITSYMLLYSKNNTWLYQIITSYIKLVMIIVIISTYNLVIY